MDVRLVALVLSIIVFVVSASVFIIRIIPVLVLRRYSDRAIDDVPQARKDDDYEQISEQSSSTGTANTIALASLFVAVLSLISSVVLGILQLRK